VNVYLTGKRRSDFFQQSSFLARSRYVPHVEQQAAVMGHFLVDDMAAGYDTKAESMLRPKRSGGPTTPKFILTDEPANPAADPREELAACSRHIRNSPEPRSTCFGPSSWGPALSNLTMSSTWPDSTHWPRILSCSRSSHGTSGTTATASRSCSGS
jgi:hypothetical protein